MRAAVWKPCYDQDVKRWILSIAAAITIALMVLPPLFDTFDTWDRHPELPLVGHNTETTVAMLAVGAGMCAAVAWASVLLLNWLAGVLGMWMQQLQMVAWPQRRATEYLLLLFSPPWAFTSLRI